MKSENKDIRMLTSKHEIVWCLDNKIYGDAPTELVSFFDALPSTPFFDYIRVLSVPHLFKSFEDNILNDTDPVQWFTEVLQTLQKDIQQKNKNFTVPSWVSHTPNKINSKGQEEVKVHTGNHYGNLFKNFDHKSYFDEAKSLLQIRLERNGIKIPHLNKSKLLDQGCGGGRYTCAWKLLGVKEAIGLDFSTIGLEDATKRSKQAEIEDVTFLKGSVLDMPFRNESFDIVFSNGVLHHTENWQKGISEQLRVLKPGGIGWLYLIEHPGGIFWDMIEILRAILKDIDKDFANTVLKSIQIPSNRIFYMLDHVLVPINTRLTPKQIENELINNGASSIKRLTRGADFDRIEYIYNKVPHAAEKFGAGENRYFFRKK